VAEIGAHESEASNLLKLNCKINDELVCCFLDIRATYLFTILIGGKTTWSRNQTNDRPHHDAIGTKHN
jgi:hypothetical protein